MDSTDATIAIIGMVASFGMPLVLVAIVLYYKHRRLRILHETIARLVEKGLPVPPELLEPPRRGHATLKGGLVLVALGIALSIFFLDFGGPWSIGLIPASIGIALLIAWRLESRARDKAMPPA
jgi:hypothetical protein